MKPSDATIFSFTGPLTETCEVRCNQCEEFSPLAEWSEDEVSCDVCGDHSAMRCPKCWHCEDGVWSSERPMVVREPSGTATAPSPSVGELEGRK